ncbi:hypothetical protein WA538_001686 [Blastocystis sp. DL]
MQDENKRRELRFQNETAELQQMVNDLEKSNSAMAIELSEARKLIESLQTEKEELQQQKAKMESLYVSVKKQQRQSVPNSPVATPSLIALTLPDEASTVPEKDPARFKGILVPKPLKRPDTPGLFSTVRKKGIIRKL